MFLYTDGAVENFDQHGNELGEQGLLDILENLGYPHKKFMHERIEEAILKQASNVSFRDDLTLLEFRWPAGS